MDSSLSLQLAQLPRPQDIAPRVNIVDYDAIEQATLLRHGTFTAVELTDAYLERIARLNGPFETYDANGGYNAFVRIDATEARAQARAADVWLRNPNDPRGPAPLLCGIPIGVKDTVAIAGRESKNGTHAFTGNVALKDATAVERLRAQGAVLLGHTICSAWSQDIFGTFAGNAWDPRRIAGGSSQGSAVAPMARLASVAIAEETGGSIIFPATANGASGIKPSLGYVSVAGVMPLSIGIDVLGSIGRSVRDAALLLNAMAGIDQRNDPLTLSAPLPLPPLPLQARGGATPLVGLTIGIPQFDRMTADITKPSADTYEPDHLQAFIRVKEELRALGARVVEFTWLDSNDPQNKLFYLAPPFFEVELPPDNFSLVTPLQALTYSNQYEADYWQAGADFALAPERPAEHRAELSRIYDTALYHTIAKALPMTLRAQAEQLRRAQLALSQKALDDEGIDFMLVLQFGAHVQERFDENAALPNRRSEHTQANVLGWPMITFPIGHGTTGVPLMMPINAVFWGPRFSEPLLVQAAIDYQTHFPYHRELPPDPTFGIGTLRPRHIPRVRDVPPDQSTDPVVVERGRRS